MQSLEKSLDARAAMPSRRGGVTAHAGLKFVVALCALGHWQRSAAAPTLVAGRHLWVYGAWIASLSILFLAIWSLILRRALRRREIVLRASEARAHAILTAAPESITVTTAEGRLLEINPAGLEMLEADSLSQAQQRPWSEWVSPKYRDAYRQTQEKAWRGEKAELEFEIEGLRGARRWLTMRAMPMRDEILQQTHILSVARNITGRKKAEALTRGQMKVMEMIAAGAPMHKTLDLLLRLIEAQAPDMLCSVLLADLDDGRVRHVAAPSLPESLVRAIDGSLIGPRAGSCGTAAYRGEPVFVEDVAEDPLWVDYRHIVLPHGLRACWSTPLFDSHHCVTGTFAIYYRQPALPQPAHLELIAIASHAAAICINRHRTEHALRQSEERFRQVVENIDEVFWMTDVDKTQLLYVSPTYEKIWGRTCASLYQSPRDWLDAIVPEDRERIQRAVHTKQITGEYDEEYRIVRPDGSIRWIHDRAFPIRDDDGKVFRVAGVAEDKTTARELEEQIRQSQKMEAIGTLAGGIAHDFNNILSTINGNAEMALQDLGEEHAALVSVKEILKAGKRARDLVQQILSFTRAEKQERHLIALRPLIEETLGFLRATLPTHVELSTSLSADAPYFLGNSTQIQQVILNVCTNAWHALGDRPGRIEVALERVALDVQTARVHVDLRPGLYACVTVHDTGDGMNEATLRRVFEPFFTTKAPGKGTGLGLSVAQRIVKSHGGAIVVQSEVNRGATFKLFFPAMLQSLQTFGEGPAEGAPQGRGQRVMYVDDEESIVLLVSRLLGRMGYRVSGFTDPQEALATFTSDPKQFDLVVTDYNMLGYTGLDVAAKILAIEPKLPILLTSGYVTDDLTARAAKMGIRQVIYKPNSVKDFCEAVHAQLNASAAPPA